MSTKQTGVVRWFNNEKGYGFVDDPDGGEAFIHYRSINPTEEGYKTLQAGQSVRYLKVPTEKGFEAQELESEKPC